MRADAVLEADILAAVLHDPRHVGGLLRYLEPDDFYAKRNRRVFEAIERVAKRDGREAVAPATVRDELARMGEDQGAVVELLDPMLGAGLVGAIEAKCRRLRDLRRYRIVEQGLSSIASEPDPDKVMDRLQEMTSEAHRLSPVDYHSMADLIDELLDEREQELRDERRIRTGLPTLDALVSGGFAPGWFVVLAARTAVGKTTLAVQVAYQALRSGQRVLYVSLEETRTQIAERIVRHAERAPRPRRGELDPLFSVASKDAITTLPLVVDTTASLEGIASIAEELSLTAESLGVVIIDYVGLVQVRRRENRVQEISEITMRLKNLAMSLRIPVVGLAQVNRSPAVRRERPALTDLRDSGSLEQDGDIVVFLHRDDKPGASTGQLMLSKNRYGPTAEFDIAFEYPTGRIVEIAR